MPGRLALHLAYQGAYSIDLMLGHGSSAAKKKLGWWGGRSKFSPAREREEENERGDSSRFRARRCLSGSCRGHGLPIRCRMGASCSLRVSFGAAWTTLCRGKTAEPACTSTQPCLHHGMAVEPAGLWTPPVRRHSALSRVWLAPCAARVHLWRGHRAGSGLANLPKPAGFARKGSFRDHA